MNDLATHLRTNVREAAVRFINGHFNNDGIRPEIRIPARPDQDTDCILVQGIKDAADRIEQLEARLTEIRVLTTEETE